MANGRNIRLDEERDGSYEVRADGGGVGHVSNETVEALLASATDYGNGPDEPTRVDRLLSAIEQHRQGLGEDRALFDTAGQIRGELAAEKAPRIKERP